VFVVLLSVWEEKGQGLDHLHRLCRSSYGHCPLEMRIAAGARSLSQGEMGRQQKATDPQFGILFLLILEHSLEKE
jgi:hypothetical protein